MNSKINATANPSQTLYQTHNITVQHVSDPSDVDRPIFPLSLPPLAKAVDGKSESFKNRKSLNSTIPSCDKPFTPFLKKKI